MFGFMHRHVDRLSDALPSKIEARSYKTTLAKGDRLAAAREEWSEDDYPTLYRDIPDDLRRPVVWDGRVLGGREPGFLVWQHLTPEILVQASKVSGYKAANLALILAGILAFFWMQAVLPFGLNLGLASTLFASDTPFLLKLAGLVTFAVAVATTSYGYLLAYHVVGGRRPDALERSILLGFATVYLTGSFGSFGLSLVSSVLPPEAMAMFGMASGATGAQEAATATAGMIRYPEWADEIGATMPVVWYYVARVAQVVSVLPGLLGAVIAAVVVYVTSFYALWTWGYYRTLKAWAAKTGAPYTIPTRDALLLHKAKAGGARDAEYRAYCRQVEDAAGRLADLPLIPVGRAVGLTRARGDMKAPQKGQVVGFDGESIRTHTLALGDTGTGKTRDVLRPLFRRIMGAVWGQDHRIGAYVTDGKGTLWRDLLPHVADRDDVQVIGTGPDHYGVDLLEGMTPLEVSSTFKAVAGQVNGTPSEDFWSESASLLVMHVATVAYALEFDDTFMDGRQDRLYSLVGLLSLATDEEAQKSACQRLNELNADLDATRAVSEDLFAQVVGCFESLVWLEQTFQKMASDTKSGIVANVNVVLGKLSGAGELTTRFARGSFQRRTDVDHALRGGVLMVAIGDTEFGLAGKVIATWLKQRFYVMAKRRLVSEPEACRNTSVAMFADEFQMLVTAGQDSDTTFWNIARESGVFLVAATQSVAALKQVIGADQTANILNLLRNKIVLSTGEVETIDYIRKVCGDLPQGWEPDEDFFATQAEREGAAPVASAPVEAKFPVPSFLSLRDPEMRTAAALDTRFVVKGSTTKESKTSSMQQAYWRNEDKSKEVLTSGLSWQPKFRHDELRHGQGFAVAMIYRAGVDRADLLDLRSI